VSPRVILDAVMRKIPNPRRESNPRTPIVQPIAQTIPTELPRIYPRPFELHSFGLLLNNSYSLLTYRARDDKVLTSLPVTHIRLV
jgi:hypothetical protein